jgi:hypothetical protein
MAGPPEFTRFVRSVEGYAVARYGADAAALIGAQRRVLTPEQRRARECPIVWDTQRIVALTKDYCRKYLRELNTAIRRGELTECTREQWEAQQAKQEQASAPAPAAATEGKAETTAFEAPPKRRRVQEADQ